MRETYEILYTDMHSISTMILEVNYEMQFYPTQNCTKLFSNVTMRLTKHIEFYIVEKSDTSTGICSCFQRGKSSAKKRGVNISWYCYVTKGIRIAIITNAFTMLLVVFDRKL